MYITSVHKNSKIVFVVTVHVASFILKGKNNLKTDVLLLRTKL